MKNDTNNLNEHRTIVLNACVAVNNILLPDLVKKIEEPEAEILEQLYVKYIDFGSGFMVQMGEHVLWESEYGPFTEQSGQDGINDYVGLFLEMIVEVTSYYKRLNKVAAKALNEPEVE